MTMSDGIEIAVSSIIRDAQRTRAGLRRERSTALKSYDELLKSVAELLRQIEVQLKNEASSLDETLRNVKEHSTSAARQAEYLEKSVRQLRCPD